MTDNNCWLAPPHLISCNAELDGHFHRLVDHSSGRLDQRHEEEWEPDDTNESKDKKASHSVFDHLLLLLSRRVWIFLDRKKRTEMITHKLECTGQDLNFVFGIAVTFSDSLQHFRIKMLA